MASTDSNVLQLSELDPLLAQLAERDASLCWPEIFAAAERQDELEIERVAYAIVPAYGRRRGQWVRFGVAVGSAIFFVGLIIHNSELVIAALLGLAALVGTSGVVDWREKRTINMGEPAPAECVTVCIPDRVHYRAVAHDSLTGIVASIARSGPVSSCDGLRNCEDNWRIRLGDDPAQSADAFDALLGHLKMLEDRSAESYQNHARAWDLDEIGLSERQAELAISVELARERRLDAAAIAEALNDHAMKVKDSRRSS